MAYDSFTYVDQEGNVHSWIPAVGGPATLAENTPADMQLAKDERGFTNPNLHRRVDPATPPTTSDGSEHSDIHHVRDNSLFVSNASDGNFLDGEIAPREYKLAIEGLHSYRTTKYVTHDEESTTSEIP